MTIPATQHAIQITGPDRFEVNPAKPVDAVGPTQLLLQVEACGICFSDTKLLHAFDAHPRKSEVVSGITPEALAEIPSYVPGGRPTVPGHEPVGRVVAVGADVRHAKVGDRVLVQADWKHLPTAKSNGAFGYNFEGALQEYVVIDERCVVTPEGEKFLIDVADGPSAAAIGLIEPWATVEGSYAWRDRAGLKPGGRLLVVLDAGAAVYGLDALVAAAAPARVVVVGAEPAGLGLGQAAVAAASLAGLDGQTFDDIVYFGADAATVETLGGLLGTRSTLNLVLGGRRLDRRIAVDVGRIHYDFIRYCGTTGSDAAAGYSWIPASTELRADDKVAIIGAAGPMGLMHTMRSVVLGVEGVSITATDLSDDRLAHLAEVIDPAAARAGVGVRYLNTGSEPLGSGYTYLTCMVPVPALVAQAVDAAADGAIVNAFAGISAGTTADIDLQGIVERRVWLFGTSGSDIADMTAVVRRIEAGQIDTTISLDAVTGIAGFADAITSVIERTSGGKIMVFPSLHDLGLVRLVDLPAKLPHVAKHLRNGLWTVEAERALLGG